MNPQPSPLGVAGAHPTQRSRRTDGEQGLAPSWVGCTIRVQWSSTRQAPAESEGLRMVRMGFILEIELLDAGHVLLEAWIEHEGGRRVVLERRPMHALISVDGTLLHVDVPTDETDADRRLASLSILIGEDEPSAMRPVFAQTSLMPAAGFGAGTSDPPSAHVSEAQRGVASA